MDYLLNCENSNIAIELLNKLREEGVRARVVPTPSSIIDSCGLSLIIDGDNDLKKINKYSDKFVAYQIESKDSKRNYIKL